jgi:Zn-dependent protease
VSEQTAPSAAASGLVGALVSTALLAAWIGWQMGWVWALAGVVGVFVHEYGHVLAINALGCGPGRLKIIPFLGGAAYPARPPETEFKGVLIALAGPVFGLLAMAPFFGAYATSGWRPWLGGAFFIAILSLINLAPAPPLDGSKAFGPALARLHPMLERLALIAVGALAVLWAINRGSYIFALFLGLGAFGALRRGQLRPWARPLTAPEWIASVVLYLAAVAICAAAVALSLDPEAMSQLAHLVGA